MNTNETSDDDLNAIRKLGEEFYEAASAGDPDRCAATMAPDVIVMPPNLASIIGKEQLRSLSRDYHMAFEEKCSLAYDEVESIGDVGFARATVFVTRTSKSDGAVETFTLRNLWILKRQADGEWRFWRIMFNTSTPTPAAKP